MALPAEQRDVPRGIDARGNIGEEIRRRGRISLVLVAVIAGAALAAFAYADTVEEDGDNVLASDQSSVDLGTVAAGATLTPYASFRLACASKNHVESGQTVNLTFTLAGSTVPAGGSL